MAGFRTGIKYTNMKGDKVRRMKVKVYMPDADECNTVDYNEGGNLYAFINANTVKGFALDMGVVKRGSQWYAFYSGTAGYEEKRLSFNPEGDSFYIEYKASSNKLEIFVDGDEYLQISSGWGATALYNEDLLHTAIEATIVPTWHADERASWLYFNETNSKGRVFLKDIKMKRMKMYAEPTTERITSFYNENLISSDHWKFQFLADPISDFYKYDREGFRATLDLNRTSFQFYRP